MTNLKPVTEGFNKFCGPAVLSILTGKSTDECANVISRINGQYKVAGVLLTDLLRAADKLGFDQLNITPSGSLFRTLSEVCRWANSDGMYIVTFKSHFVCIEIKEKLIYFCDNHTKEPIPAASAARLGDTVVAMHKVIEREKLPEPPKPILVSSEIKVYKYDNHDGSYMVKVNRELKYDIASYNKTEYLADFRINNDIEYSTFVNKVYKSLVLGD